MKILRLQAENVKRLSAVEIIPDGTLVRIGGKNAAGKSSVLDSIAYALGGKSLVPAEPIRKGQKHAKIEVDLGEFVVTRRFARAPLLCDCNAAERNPGGATVLADHTAACASHTFSDTTSTLVVRNKDGFTAPSPQAILDKLLGKLTFDPLLFAHALPREQAETLRQLTNLDFWILNQQKRTLLDHRTLLKRQHTQLVLNVSKMPFHKDAPDVEVSTDEIAAAMRDADVKKKTDTDAQKNLDAVTSKRDAWHATCRRLTESWAQQRARHVDKIEGLKRQLELAVTQYSDEAKAEDARVIAAAEEDTKHVELVAAAQAVQRDTERAIPNIDFKQQLDTIAATNAKVRDNAVYRIAHTDLEEVTTSLDDLHIDIDALDEQKAATLAAAKFPVPGLGLSDDGVTFNGLPFEQASAAEQLRVSVAIGLALNPTLRVLLVRNGNQLDEDSLALLRDYAEQVDAQVWMEWVTSNSEGMSVVIEDGHVK